MLSLLQTPSYNADWRYGSDLIQTRRTKAPYRWSRVRAERSRGRSPRFYCDYMTTEDCFSVLPPVPAAAIRTTAQGNEKHVRSLLFKLAVEMDMMMNILAEAMEIPEEQLRKLRV